MFAILDVKSAYTFLDGTMSVKEIVDRAHHLNYSALAINDLNNLHHVMELKEACERKNIKALYSLRVQISHDEPMTYLLYAKNNQGYHDLLKLSTLLSDSSYNLDYESLLLFTNDCVVIVYGEGGIIESTSVNTQSYLQLYKNTLKDFYIGISNNNSNKWKVDNDNLKLLCYSLNIKTVALPKVEFNRPSDIDIKKLFTAMQHGRTFNDHKNYVNDKNYFLSLSEIKEYYDIRDIEASLEIANKCNVSFETLEKATLPIFKNNMGVDSVTYLNSLCKAGLERRLDHHVTKDYVDRLRYELTIINDMGYSDYFLIVYDVILFARNQNIYVGPGRGSSAGSLVAYVLGITHIDPIKNNLLFERFLNPERIGLPDIDIDFPDDRRAEVLDYVVEKYGSDHVSQIVTYGTFAARQALRDVGKALSIPNYKLDTLSKLITGGPKATLDSTYQENIKFKKMIDDESSLTLLFKLAKGIEGLPRHTSLHAAGIVMSSKVLTDHVPLLKLNDKEYSTQYSMNYLEELGLNKIDFLGLRNLSIIAEVSDSIDDFDILKIPLDDKKTFELLSEGETKGIFQLESYGMSKLIKDLKPYQYTDLVDAIALYRPGPVANIPMYLKNRKEPQHVEYIHDDLKGILSETYGVIIYQEQIMQIAQLMAGFSLGKADILRKAMSSKQKDLLVSLREEFIIGSMKKGYSKKIAVEVYDLIEKFANYGFNKAHSYAYGLIAYQMAYLKANYYLEFYLALLNGVIGSSKKTHEYTQESKRAGIHIFAPNINYSGIKFMKSNSSILFPLVSIKGVGNAVAAKIINERESGIFTDFFDFVARVNILGISKSVMESLIYSGALDFFKYNRTTLIQSLDQALMYANLVKVESDNLSLDFDIVSKPKIIKYERNRFLELEKEKEVLGFYLSTHPIVEYKESINYLGDNIAIVKEKKQTNELLVYVSKIKTHRTKRGDLMAFVEVVDELDVIDIVIMPNIYERISDSLIINKYVSLSGKIDRNDSILVRTLKIVENDERM